MSVMAITNKLSKNYIMWSVAVLCCILWGSAFPMIKVGYSAFGVASGDTPSIILFAGCRFLLAGILTIIIFSVVEKRLLLPTRRALPCIGILSVFQTVLQYLFFYLGLAFTTGTKASIINGTGTLFVLLISCFVFRQESFSIQKLTACILGFCGVAVSGLTGLSGLNFNKGDLFIILSAVSYAMSTVLMRRFSSVDNPATLSGYQFILGGGVMIIIGFCMGGKLCASGIGSIGVLIYLAFVSAFAYSLWSFLLKYNDAGRVSVCGSMTPIFGFLLSLIILREQGTGLLSNVFGLLLVVLSMIISNLAPKRDCN